MKYIFPLLLVIVLGGNARAQSTVSPGSETFQMLRIAERYRYAPDLSFTVNIKYTDSLSVDSVAEELNAVYKLHGGLFYTYIDSTEIVQGSRYSIRVNHYDSTITIRNRSAYPDVMNMPVTDTLYWKTFAQSFSVTNVNDSVRTLKVIFKPGAGFTSYEIRYSTRTYLLEYVKCYMPANSPGVEPDLFPSGKALILFTFSGYSNAPVSGDWFSEDRFITVINGVFQPKSAYSGYFIEPAIQ
ncbi:MAG: hypothetical protein QM763_01975 [Agriterribacter sp.]